MRIFVGKGREEDEDDENNDLGADVDRPLIAADLLLVLLV